MDRTESWMSWQCQAIFKCLCPISELVCLNSSTGHRPHLEYHRAPGRNAGVSGDDMKEGGSQRLRLDDGL